MSSRHKKPFLTIEEQINLLESRGLIFHDKENARKTLLSENYYSVINGYKRPFLDPDKTNADIDVYKPGTCFELIELVYLFDKALRRITLPRLLDAENSMRTAVIYAFCEKHREDYAYLDPANYCSPKEYGGSKKNYSRNLITLLSKLLAISSNTREESIKHYEKKYGVIPLWVASKFITFGVMSNFYELQSLDIKQKACMYMTQITSVNISPRQLVNTYKILSKYRNICAHEERMYCSRVGRNKENSCRDMITALSFVINKNEMSEYANALKSLIESMRRNSIYTAIMDEILNDMKIDDSFLETFIIDKSEDSLSISNSDTNTDAKNGTAEKD